MGKTQVHHSVFRCQAYKMGVKIKGEEWRRQDEWDILCSRPSSLIPTALWHPSIHRQKCREGDVGSGTLCQGTWERYHPPKCQGISLQTLVSAMDSKVAHELAPAAPWEHTGSHADESRLGNPQVQWRSSSIWLSKKKICIWKLWRGKRTSVTFLTSSSPKAAQLTVPRDTPAMVSPLRWGVRWCVWAPSFTNCRREVHFSPTLSGVLSLREQKEAGENSKSDSQKVLKGTQILLTMLQTPLCSFSTSCWGHLGHESH